MKFEKLIDFVNSMPRSIMDCEIPYDVWANGTTNWAVVHYPDGLIKLIDRRYDDTKRWTLGHSFNSGVIEGTVCVVEVSVDGKEIWLEYKK